jgi:hypothetical protein
LRIGRTYCRTEEHGEDQGPTAVHREQACLAFKDGCRSFQSISDL